METAILTTSLVALIAAAVMALRLAWRGRSWAWLCLAAAMIIFSAIRGTHLANLLAGHQTFRPIIEPLVLAASFAALAGLGRMALESSRTYEELRTSEDFHRRIVDSLPGGLIYFRLDGAVLRANQEAQRMLGLSYDQITHRYLQDWDSQTIYEDGTPCPSKDYPGTRCLQTGVAQPPATIGVRRPDGQVVWGVFSALPVIDVVSRRRTGAVVMFLDITQRKRNEERLAFQASVLAQVNDAVFVTDADRRVVYWNRGAQRLYGYSEGQALGLKVNELLRFSWDDPATEAQVWAEFQARREWRGELVHVHQDGHRILVDVSSSIRIDPETGRDTHLTIIRDVTQRRGIEQALRDSQERYRALVENSPDAIYIRSDATFAYVNQAAVRLFGAASAQDLLGRPVLDFMHPDDHPIILQRRAMLEQGLSVPVTEHRVVRKDGTMVAVEVMATRCTYDGKPAVQVAAHDIDDRKKAEAALRRSQEHYRLAAEFNRRLLQEVNHRVRNNLGSLLGLISLSRRKAGDAQEFAAMLEARVMVMTHVHNILAQSGWRDLNLRSLVLDLMASLQHIAPYATPVNTDGPPTRISPRQGQPLAMTILELFTNSCKHGAHSTPTGRVSLTWATIHDPAGGPDRIRVAWRETDGPPITGRVHPSLGTELIEGFVGFELGGTCRLTYPRQGAAHEIEFAVDDTAAREAATEPVVQGFDSEL